MYRPPMLRITRLALVVGSLTLMLGCGSSQKHADSPDSTENDEAARQAEELDAMDELGDSNTGKSDQSQKEEGDSKDAAPSEEPKFVEGMSVNEAINAVPQGLPRENIEEEVMNKPLLDMSLYAPCKLPPSQHFEIRFAIWDGRVVGLDITTTPKNEKAAACLREAVSRASWKDKTKSLNISTVSF